MPRKAAPQRKSQHTVCDAIRWKQVPQQLINPNEKGTIELKFYSNVVILHRTIFTLNGIDLKNLKRLAFQFLH